MQRRIILAAFYLIISHFPILCQDLEQHRLRFSVSSGYVKNTSSDRLLNYYTYTGGAFLPIQLEGSYLSNKNLFLVNISYGHLKSYPENLNSTLYEYNYINNWNAGLSIGFYRNVLPINQFLQFFVGLANNAYTTLQEENYQNLLYDYAKGYRISYDVALLNLSPELLVDAHVKKHSVRIKIGYTVVNIAARPDDDYTKQIGIGNEFHWKTNFPKNYKGSHFSVVYQFMLSKNIGLTAEYNNLYHAYVADKYQYLQQSYLIGISKKF